MRSATVTAALWFLVGVAAALSWTSLAPLTIPLVIVLAVVALRGRVCATAGSGRRLSSGWRSCSCTLASVNGASPTAARPARSPRLR
jgi:hypothetical protein